MKRTNLKQITLCCLVMTMLAAFSITSCNKSSEDKANVLIRESMKKSLYFPESYDAVETVIDSAFAPKDDPAVYDELLTVAALGKLLEEYTEKVKIAEQSMAIYDGSSPFEKTQYNEAKEERDKYTKAIEELEAKVVKTFETITKLAEPGRKFIGWKATHRYRAKNNAGNILMGKEVFILDERFTKVLANYDTDSDDYKSVQALFFALKERAEAALDLRE